MRPGTHSACFDAGVTLNNMSLRLVKKIYLDFEVWTNLDKVKGKINLGGKSLLLSFLSMVHKFAF